ncbi:LPXTG cell wall anchor domain-containing protein [Clostridium tepidum]
MVPSATSYPQTSGSLEHSMTWLVILGILVSSLTFYFVSNKRRKQEK